MDAMLLIGVTRRRLVLVLLILTTTACLSDLTAPVSVSLQVEGVRTDLDGRGLVATCTGDACDGPTRLDLHPAGLPQRGPHRPQSCARRLHLRVRDRQPGPRHLDADLHQLSSRSGRRWLRPGSAVLLDSGRLPGPGGHHQLVHRGRASRVDMQRPGPSVPERGSPAPPAHSHRERRARVGVEQHGLWRPQGPRAMRSCRIWTPCRSSVRSCPRQRAVPLPKPARPTRSPVAAWGLRWLGYVTWTRTLSPDGQRRGRRSPSRCSSWPAGRTTCHIHRKCR